MMLSTKSAAVAQGLTKYGVNHDVAINPIILQLIQQLLSSLLPLITGGCTPPASKLTPEQATERLHNLTILDRLQLRVEIADALGDRDAVQMLATPIRLSVLDQARAIKVDEVTQMMSEVDA